MWVMFTIPHWWRAWKLCAEATYNIWSSRKGSLESQLAGMEAEQSRVLIFRCRSKILWAWRKIAQITFTEIWMQVVSYQFIDFHLYIWTLQVNQRFYILYMLKTFSSQVLTYWHCHVPIASYPRNRHPIKIMAFSQDKISYLIFKSFFEENEFWA